MREADAARAFFRENTQAAESIICEAAQAEAPRILAEVESFVGRYVIVPAPARLVIALWGIATHLAECFDSFPYLSLSSPVPRCGKTRVLEVLELICARPWRGTAPTEAALFRFIEASRPTLLLDEGESLAARKKGNRDSAVLAILNAGYKKGQMVPRCVGASHILQHFHVYGPKAFSCIGRLPGALGDRSIQVVMQRRRPGDKAARFRFGRAAQEAAPIREAVEETAKVFASVVVRTYSNLPDLGCLTDREEELFAPLFSLCAILSPARIQELENCAVALSEAKAGDAVDDALGLRLLADVRLLWPDRADAVLTERLLDGLRALSESPWAGEVELSPRKLARLLRGFDVRSRDVRTQEGRGKGYIRQELEGAFDRYLPADIPEIDSEA